MAALSVASVIVEASDTSGALHQAAECVRLKRWLFIPQITVDDRLLAWPLKFLRRYQVRTFKSTQGIIDLIATEL